MTVRSLVALVVLLVTLVGIAGTESACLVTGKTRTDDETQKCDDDLSACIAKSPCDNPADPSYQTCVNACKQAQCDCLTACGSTCTK
ncbi:hypothetical protein BH09MYX1_BH09MYX1_56960 [soil metagenome]